MPSLPFASLRLVAGLTFLAALSAFTPEAAAQGTGTVAGRVTRAGETQALAGVSVSARGTGQVTVTGTDGRYTLRRVPAGEQTIVFRWVGYRAVERAVTVTAGATAAADATLEVAPVQIGDIIVSGASKTPERVVEAPAAISTVSEQMLDNTSITGQAPVALATVPGVDVVQSGVNDFNVNARGFNSSLNRRVLVLQDGRDLAIAFLGSQEWNGLPLPLEDISRIEVVRGPGSALYGANAFSGVVSISTPAAREVIGTKLTLAGGELNTVRGDLRHAGLAGDGRLGYRLNFGYNTSDSWTRSRTAPGDLAEEYGPATDEPLPAVTAPEALPLAGQTLDPTTREALGDADRLQNMYGTGRFDVYSGNGVVTVEGGAARVENEVLVSGIGRVQIIKALKPYARVVWAQDRFNVMAYWNNRTSLEPQRSLASGLNIEETSNIFHVEAQGNQTFGDARAVVGASARNYRVNTFGTLMALADDDRSDEVYSAFGQLEYKVTPQIRVVGAIRFDDGTLFDPQYSPKGAIVFSPNENHSFRVTVNRAFQTPNYSEFFLRAPAAAPANFYQLEQGLRASPLGPALAGVPDSALFTTPVASSAVSTSASVPVLALGNANLDVERVLGFEAGYKANLGSRAYVTLDAYTNTIKDFVTDLLPGVNPSYGLWTAPEQVPAPFRPALENAVRSQLAAAGQTLAAAGLSRDVNGNSAIIVSYANAGEVTERGLEFGIGYQLTPEFGGEVSFTAFDFDITEGTQAAGDKLIPNTPGKKANIALAYVGSQGIDANVSVRLIDGYPWAAGVFSGYVPASELINLSAGYRINNFVRIHATATNLLDQQRFQLYGGSVIGRRVLGGVTATF